MRSYSIGELTREFGVTARALRFYEDKDLLHPAREGQTRIYSHRDRGRLKVILQGKSVGFSLSEIREILDVYTLEGRSAQLELTLIKFREQIRKLETQRENIEAALQDLRDGVAWAEARLAEPSAPDPDQAQFARAFDKVARRSLDSQFTV